MATSTSVLPTIDAETFYTLATRVEELSSRIQTLEGREAQVQPDAKRTSESNPFSKDRIGEVLEITKSLFSGPVTTHMMSDPSEPQYPWLVFRVEQNLKPGEYSNMLDHWYKGVTPIWPSDPLVYRLMVDPIR